MPELREVFDMTTKQIEPDLGAWNEQERRQRRSTRNRRIGTYLVVAAIAVAAGTAIFLSREAARTTPAGEQRRSLEPTSIAERQAIAVAEGFVEAIGAFDAERAMTYLAPLAQLPRAVLPEDLPMLVSFYEAEGYQQMVEPCRVTGTSAGLTFVRCPFDFHAIRSDEMGLGPYHGSSWELRIANGKILSALQIWEIKEFSPQLWGPFADWVKENYPEDFLAMYVDRRGTNFVVTRQSIRLWEKHTIEYVDVVNAGT